MLIKQEVRCVKRIAWIQMVRNQTASQPTIFLTNNVTEARGYRAARTSLT
jgi:hypothetical protein